MNSKIELEEIIDRLKGIAYLIHNSMMASEEEGTHRWQADGLEIVCIYLEEIIDDLEKIAA